MTCINKSLPAFKAISELYGDDLADAMVRSYPKNFNNKNLEEFYIPTKKELNKWLHSSKEETKSFFTDAIRINPYMTKEAIIASLKGIIRKKDDLVFIITGRVNAGSLINKIEVLKNIYKINLNIIEGLAIKHPNIFKIINTKTNYVKIVEITPNKKPEPKSTQDSLFSQEEANIKPGVEKLFDSNPELANQVYEALGFEQDKQVRIQVPTTLNNYSTTVDVFDENKNKIGVVDIQKRGEGWVTLHPKLSEKGYGESLYSKISEYYTIIESAESKSKQGNKLWDKLENKGVTNNGLTGSFSPSGEPIIQRAVVQGTFKLKNQITPQQKQQALQQYSQYLDTGKQDIEGFKEFVNKGSNQNIEQKTDLRDIWLEQRLFSESRITNSLDILNKIANSDHSLNTLAAHLIPFAKYNNVKISLVEDIPSTTTVKNPNGMYNSFTNEIEIKRTAGFTNSRAEATILHEIIHSLTYDELRKNTEVNQYFTELYNYASLHLGVLELYGLSNKDEFMTALFTDANFIKALQGIPPLNKKKYTNLFQEVFDKILNLLRISKNSSFYEEAFSTATHIIENSKQRAIEQKEYEEYIKSDVYEESLGSEEIQNEDTTKNKIAIDRLFNSLPILNTIGTQEQYLRYFNSFSSNTSVPIIVYRAVREEDAELKDKSFFTDDPEYAKKYGEFLKPYKLNILNPYVSEKIGIHRATINNMLKDISVDGIIGKESLNNISMGAISLEIQEALEQGRSLSVEMATKQLARVLSNTNSYVTINKNQIHELGTETDIDNFKEFVRNDAKILDKKALSLYNKIFNILEDDINEHLKNCG
jgi:hypothetical protein